MGKELFSNENEQCVLGTVFLDHINDGGCTECSEHILTNLTAKDFHSPTNRVLFVTMQSLFNRGLPVDLPTIVAELESKNYLEKCGGIQYICELNDSVPSTANYKHYAGIVKELSRKRRLVEFSNYITKQTQSGDFNADELLSEFDKCLSALSLQAVSHDLEHISVPLATEIARMMRSASGEYETFGVKTGFKEFDECLWGMRPGNMIVIGGRPGGGKTDFALNTLFNASVFQNKTCTFFSLEMTKEEIVRRLIGIGGAIDANDIISGRAWKNEQELILRIQKLLDNGKLHIDDTTNQTPQQLLSKAKKLKRKQGLDLVVIDYLGKIKPPRSLNNPVTETGEIACAVKDIARTMKVPVMCLCQLNRNSEQKDRRGSSEALMSDLRGSGEIEQEADVIAFLRPDPKLLDQETRPIYLQMTKNRHGRMKNIQFDFTGKHHIFKEIRSADAVQVAPEPVQEELPFDTNDLGGGFNGN